MTCSSGSAATIVRMVQGRDRRASRCRLRAWPTVAVLICVALAAGCGSGNGQAGSSLSSALSSAASGGAPSATGSTTAPTSTSTASSTVTSGGPTVSTSVTILGAAGSTTGAQESGSGNDTSGWLYAAAGAAAVALLAAAVWVIRRQRRRPASAGPVAAGPAPRSLPERQAILLAALGQRVATGWTVVAQTTDTATVRRAGEVTQIHVDELGTLHEGAVPLPSGAPPGDRPPLADG